MRSWSKTSYSWSQPYHSPVSTSSLLMPSVPYYETLHSLFGISVRSLRQFHISGMYTERICRSFDFVARWATGREGKGKNPI